MKAPQEITTLTSKIQHQWACIEKVDAQLKARVNRGLDSPSQLDSAAYQVHNLYCSIEDLFKLIDHNLERDTSSRIDGWDRILLLRMTQPIEDIRPALLSEESFDLLNRLRSFRHMFRHAYSTEIELSQLQPNIDKALQASLSVKKDIARFLETLTNLGE